MMFVIQPLVDWKLDQDLCMKHFCFLRKGSSVLVYQVQEQQACWVLFSFFPPFWKELVSHGFNNLKHNNANGQINKQANRKACRAGVDQQPNALAWANAASETFSSKLFGCQRYSLSKWGSRVVPFQEMLQEKDSCSRWQAEKLSWVNVL